MRGAGDGIEPAWPAWKVLRPPEAAAELAPILGIAVSMDAGRPRPVPEALARAVAPAEQRGDGPDSAGAAASTPADPPRQGRRRPGRPGAATDRGRRAAGRGARGLAGARRSGA